MNTLQKVVKAFGIVLAALIIAGIVFGVLRAASFVLPRLHPQKEVPVSRSYQSDESFSEVRIELAAGANIKSGETFSIATQNPYVEYSISQGVLTIREKTHTIFDYNLETTEIVLPDLQYDAVSVKVGAGTFELEKLNTKRLNFEFGAGKVTIGSLTASQSCKLESGSGALEIKDGNLFNSEMELGVGKFDYTGTLHGKSEIECGIGKVSIHLTDPLKEYTLIGDRGITSIRLNGVEMKNDQEYGTGANIVKIESGIGEVEITAENG